MLPAGFLPGGTRTLIDIIIVMTEQSARLFPTRNLVLDLDHVWASRTQTDVIRTGALWPEAGEEEEEDVEEAEGQADVEEEVDVEEAGAGASW